MAGVMSCSSSFAAVVALALVFGAAAARGEYGRTPRSDLDPSALAIDESRFLGTPLDADLPLLGEDGRRFTLGDLLGKPVLLLFAYYSCDGACPAVNRKLAEAVLGAEKRAGEHYVVLTLSFDRKDRPADIRHFVHALGADERALRGWHFAVFADDADIQRIAASVGYRYFWSVRERMFVHPNRLIALSPQGRVVRYLPAWSIGARDIDLALIESDWGRVSASRQLIDIASGICYSYSFKEGRYVLNAPLFIAAGSLTLGVASMIAGFAAFRRFRRKEVARA